MNCSKKKRYGFTLIELLVVISIIALLMSVMMPALGRARKLAQSVTCKSQLKDIGVAFNMYTQEYKGNVVHTAGSSATDAAGRWMKRLGEFMYQRNQNTSGDPYASAQQGGIYDFDLFRCPVEAAKARKAGFNADGLANMGNTGVYGYNQFFTGYAFTAQSYSVIPNNTKQDNAWRKFDDIVSPQTLPLFADTNSDDPLGTGMRGSWWLSAKGPHPIAYTEYNWNGGVANASKERDKWAPFGPAANHAGKSNYLMADGHAETKGIWDWRDHLGTDFHPKRNVKAKPPTPPADYFL